MVGVLAFWGIQMPFSRNKNRKSILGKESEHCDSANETQRGSTINVIGLVDRI